MIKNFIFILTVLSFISCSSDKVEVNLPVSTPAVSKFIELVGKVQNRDNLESIFKRHNLDKQQMYAIYHSSKDTYDLSRISAGNSYIFELEKESPRIRSLQYVINKSSYLHVLRKNDTFTAEKITIEPEIKTGSFTITIKDNLIASMPGNHSEYHKMAMKLADIYAWDIDFSSELRNGDTLKLIVEEQWIEGAFKGYGNILASEFINNGATHKAYRFEDKDYADYFDESGRSLRKALLRAPIKFKYISSGYSKRRFHPVLKRYRSHLGIDYAAPQGTPVSAAGSGTIVFAGRKGQNGKMVQIRHNNGYETFYGHLSKYGNKIRTGRKVAQGDIIGYVGSTGLSTGPHLDYRMKINGRNVNPLTVKLPRGKAVSKDMMVRFRSTVEYYASVIASMQNPMIASGTKEITES